MTDKTLEELTGIVADQAATLDSAIGAERSELANVLQTIVDNVRPALRALSSRILNIDEEVRGVRLTGPDDDNDILVLTDDGNFALCNELIDDDVGRFGNVSVEEVVRLYSVGEIVTTIREKLEQYARGNATKTAKRALEQAERLKAIAVLIRQ